MYLRSTSIICAAAILTCYVRNYLFGNLLDSVKTRSMAHSIGGRQVFKTNVQRVGLLDLARVIIVGWVPWTQQKFNLVCGNLRLSASSAFCADIIIIILFVVHPRNLDNIHLEGNFAYSNVLHESTIDIAKNTTHNIWYWTVIYS